MTTSMTMTAASDYLATGKIDGKKAVWNAVKTAPFAFALGYFGAPVYAYYKMPLGFKGQLCDDAGNLADDAKNLADDAAQNVGLKGFKSEELLTSHYQKHGSEFGNITKEQYLLKAQSFVQSKSGGNILTKIRANGDVIIYDTATNEFAVKTSEGTIRTYFKPSGGLDYFNRQ